ncbi:hypothetical protein BDZ97DRAFT_1924898 [Flammula alnicola]|nr:hypothetical protein BDZ97DRAFT_1924898 [Flammula alnicola]
MGNSLPDILVTDKCEDKLEMGGHHLPGHEQGFGVIELNYYWYRVSRQYARRSHPNNVNEQLRLRLDLLACFILQGLPKLGKFL